MNCHLEEDAAQIKEGSDIERHLMNIKHLRLHRKTAVKNFKKFNFLVLFLPKIHDIFPMNNIQLNLPIFLTPVVRKRERQKLFI